MWFVFSEFFSIFQEWKSYLFKLPRNRFTLCVFSWMKENMAIYAVTFGRRFLCAFLSLSGNEKWEYYFILLYSSSDVCMLNWRIECMNRILTYANSLHFYFSFFFTLCVPYFPFSWRRKSTIDFCFWECTSMNMITFNTCASFEIAKSVTDFLVHSLLAKWNL